MAWTAAPDLDGALEQMLKGLSTPSMAELAVSTLGNVCLAGQLVPVFKEQLLPFCDELVDALKNRLKAEDWRLCGRAAGAICNIVRLGPTFSTAVHERCIEPIMKALRDEQSSESSSAFLSMMKSQMGGLPGGNNFGSKSTGRLLGALANLLAVRGASAEAMIKHGAWEVVMPLFDADYASRPSSQEDDATPAEISARAAQIINGLLAALPKSLSVPLEVQLFDRMWAVLKAGQNFPEVKAAAKARDNCTTESLQMLDLVMRMLTTVIVKTPGSLSRLVAASSSPGVVIQELPDDFQGTGVISSGDGAQSLPCGIVELADRLLTLLRAIQPTEYVTPDEEGGVLSRIRGNMALLFASVAEAQTCADALPALKKVDLSQFVSPFLVCLRKERSKAQNNVGVVVTRLAQNPRYRELVRNENGFETLHQIQLPRVEAVKEKEQKIHRIKGPVAPKDDLD
jgi:hypothetical protein